MLENPLVHLGQKDLYQYLKKRSSYEQLKLLRDFDEKYDKNKFLLSRQLNFGGLCSY